MFVRNAGSVPCSYYLADLVPFLLLSWLIWRLILPYARVYLKLNILLGLNKWYRVPMFIHRAAFNVQISLCLPLLLLVIRIVSLSLFDEKNIKRFVILYKMSTRRNNRKLNETNTGYSRFGQLLCWYQTSGRGNRDIRK